MQDRWIRSLTPAAMVLLLATGGCTRAVQAPKLGGLYSEAAMHHDEHRNPVVVIPGILGSRLIDGESKRVVWGAFGGGSVNPSKAADARLLAHPIGEGVPLSDLRDTVQPDGALDRVHVSLFGLPVELDAYIQILTTLGVGGYRDEGLALAGAVDYGDHHFTCFQFDYDWRRDLAENAARLDQFLKEKRIYVQAERRKRFGTADTEVKFDIIAHSMGGLLTRYYLRYGGADLPPDGSAPRITWAGAPSLDRVILVGTPNAGSAESLTQLVRGVSFAPFLPTYQPALLGTMPAIYQLLPRPRHRPVVSADDPDGPPIDIFDPAVWERYEWGLAAPNQDSVLVKLLPDAPDAATRRRIALDHLRKCLDRARQVAAALDSPAAPPAGVQLFLFAGDAEDTLATISVDGRTGRLRAVADAPGDGTVLRTSALLDERVGSSWRPGLVTPIRWNSARFLFTDHIGLTKDPAFSDNVLFILLEQMQ